MELSYSDDPPIDVAVAAAHIRYWRTRGCISAELSANKLFAKFLAHVRGNAGGLADLLSQLSLQ